jgi:hypothetical protein
MRSPLRRQVIRACWPALALLAVDCQRPAALVLRQADNAGASLSSIVYTGDPNSAPQLVRGFFEIEDYSWRWTAQRFSVVLRPPLGATGESATLTMALAVSDGVIAKLGNITLDAAIGPTSLSPETYTKSGSYTYIREIPASLLTKEEVQVDFRLDKAMKPDGRDIRELGIIVSSVGLEPR